MQVHRALPTRKLLEGAVMTVGTFDGVHRGHQQLVERLRDEAARLGVPAVLLTFEDMPICTLAPEKCPPLLTLAAEKSAAFAQTDLDHLFIVPFTREIAATSARDFMTRWKYALDLQVFVGGPDFALGKGREGTIDNLKILGQELGFEAHSLEGKLLDTSTPISSTRVRGEVLEGRVESAARMLGRSYELSGSVVKGDQIGRTLGFPTINIEPNARKCVPGHGVYAVRARFDGKVWPAALNIGMRPTFGALRRQIEFHVIGTTIEHPPETVTIEFVARLRDEIRFSDLDALRAQLKIDIQEAIQQL